MLVARTPQAENWPRLAMPGQGEVQGPVWATVSTSWDDWKLRPANTQRGHSQQFKGEMSWDFLTCVLREVAIYGCYG